MSLEEALAEPLLATRTAPEEKRRSQRSRLANGSQLGVVLPWTLLGLVLLYVNRAHLVDLVRPEKGHAPRLPACRSPDAPSVRAPHKNVWKNLDIAEATQVRDWLFAKERGLNITHSNVAADSDNFIHYVETLRPAKNVSLAYFTDHTIEVPRYAHAIVHNASSERIIDYKIGPLPVSHHTTIQPITEIYHSPEIPLNARSTFNWTTLGIYFKHVMTDFTDITEDLFGGSIQNGTLVAAGVGPMSYDGTWRRTWVQLRRNVPGVWLVPVDFYLYIDMTGTDPSLFKILSIVHNEHVYANVTELAAAWSQGKLVKSPPGHYKWASRRPRGPRLDLDDRAGPQRVITDGARFRVDTEEDYVSWMGWSFYLSFERDMGLRLWDINFRGERIIYELSPQEALAQYSGNNPHQATTAWLDRAFGMGQNVREVILGYDCPADAMLLNATVHELGSTTRPNAVCIFETDHHIPLSRHTGMGKDESGVVKGYELVVRSISSVGNYDYVFDYTFQLDGTIEIRVSASGYLQGGVWSEAEAAYGHRIQQTSMGSLHDHVINFKVDFDVAGERNSMSAISLEVEEKEVPWLSEDWGGTLVQQKIARKPIKTESKLNYPLNMQGAYVITNEQKRNAWGNPRGYVIHPGPTVHLTNLGSKRTEHNVDWAKHHLAVTRRYESEPESSSPWNMNLPGKPPVDFDQFVDGESIEQEDLVVWLNLGSHHIPRAEDSPNTLTNLATSYVLLAPYNFNDYDVSIDSSNSMIMSHEGRWVVKEKVTPSRCAPRDPPPLSYTGIRGFDEAGSIVQEDRDMLSANSGLRSWV